MHKFTKKNKDLKHKNTLTQSNKKIQNHTTASNPKKELAVDIGAIYVHN